MEEAKDDKSSVGSQKSSSSSASAASAAARARAKAEAARARATFAEREVQLKLERAERKAKLQLEEARLDAELGALTLQREAAAAIAQAEVLEAAVEEETGTLIGRTSKPVAEKEIAERTCQYVEAQSNMHAQALETQIRTASALAPQDDEEGTIIGQSSAHDIPNTISGDQDIKPPKVHHANSDTYAPFPAPTAARSHGDTYAPFPAPTAARSSSRTHPGFWTEPRISNQPMDPRVQSFVPRRTMSSVGQTHGMEHFARYLARRELVSTGLVKFDDHPESYRAWQSSFINTIKDLELTSSEELDLMVKWLGKESVEHVRRIRAVHISNPDAALRKAWARLNECYASPEVIECALYRRLDCFPKISNKDYVKLRELGDLLMELLAAKEDGYLPGLAYLDTGRGIAPIVEKLPYGLQEKWLSHGSRYKDEHGGHFPPFSYFTEFVCYEARTRNDPSFALPVNSSAPVRGEKPSNRYFHSRTLISAHKTEVSVAEDPSGNTTTKKITGADKICPIHNKPHPLKKCRGFRAKPIEERRAFLKENGICYRCCASTSHLAKACKVTVKCGECESERHLTAMHAGPAPQTFQKSSLAPDNGEEEEITPTTVDSQCTEVCSPGRAGRSCSKICLARVYPQGQRERAVNVYVILDDQSNRSLARSDFFETFNIQSLPSSYSLRTCAGRVDMSGRKAEGFQIESVDGTVTLPLPPLIECNQILNNRSEIPTPEAAHHHAHLKIVADHIPQLDPKAQILLLLGRDIIRLHKVRQQINGPHNAPFAQRLDLGWVLVGDVCLGSVHKPVVSTFHTNVLENGRPSFLTPCESFIQLKERVSYGGEQRDSLTISTESNKERVTEHMIGDTVFNRTKEDNRLAPSIEDTLFLKTMDEEVYRDGTNSWVAPLPFRTPRQHLPNNREQALTRLKSLRRTLDRKPKMKEQFVTFMGKMFENDHAEPAPTLKKNEECWYLPIFGVYHPQKPDQIRVVFDSSAQHCGVSLNNVLLTGPDLNNSLLGVLIRFRREKVAVTTDIQQMFHCFRVKEDHRDFLRFLWYRDNDLSKDIIEYRMKVHIFGNSPSPAVAIYGLRRAAQEGALRYGADTQRFVERHFYVDDGLTSLPTDVEAINLLKRTQASLTESNLRLHKIASNHPTVMEAFGREDYANSLKDLDLSKEILPMQRSLGMSWEIGTDTFTFAVSDTNKPFTRRGVLSTVNSLFDPLGLVAPVTIQGRALLRELTKDVHDWDEPLPEDRLTEWQVWRNSLQDLKQLHIPRPYTNISLSKAENIELCVFSDASTMAIGAVAYLRADNGEGQMDVGFIMGKAKLAPQSEPTIPRLELCAAVLAVEMAEFILQEIDLKPNTIRFFCDSKVVLGYIYNETKRFYVYVHNRVQRIRQFTRPEQWFYIPTEQNPADLASRSVQASCLSNTIWLTGPAFLRKPDSIHQEEPESFELVDPDVDGEIRPQVKSFATQIKAGGLTADRFKRFSTWRSLVRAVSLLIHIARSYKSSNQSSCCTGWHRCSKVRSPDELLQAMYVIVKSVQAETFLDEITALTNGTTIPKGSSVFKLNPILEETVLKIGGRLKNAPVDSGEKTPFILPRLHHISTLLVRHHHERVKHQGRHFTEGALREAGIWIVGGKRLVSSIIHTCVTCRKLRGKTEQQKMADLPPQRLSMDPPFTHVGLDVFGPWTVTARRTRGGQAFSKRWAVLFTCMSTRAVHIEVIESMDASSCINALRRFFSIRGPAKHLKSDRGTNFISASKELGMNKAKADPSIQQYLSDQGCTWEFNPPHSSHMGGAWERMIGVARRILDCMLLQERTHLSHEVLCTLMAEVSAIINARPLTPVSTDPDSPFILSPAMILTQKEGLHPPPGTFTDADLFKRQWRQVQALADRFWTRWRREFLPTLQSRRKWNVTHRNLKKGDVVLLKDEQVARNDWPMALVTSVFPSADGRVRKVELKTTNQGSPRTFLRPATQVILLLPDEEA